MTMAAYGGPDSDLMPDAAATVAFCQWWYEKCNKGVLEIGWMDAGGRGLIHFEQFARDDLDALAATAIQANLVPGQAMYIRAATVMPWGNGPRKTTDMDVEQAPGVWSDIDSLEDFERAKTVQTMVRPNAQVITGTVPHPRVQSWFRCSEPITVPDLVKALNVRLHKLYGGDPSVVNPSRLMRLPGMIAWPRKEGRIPEIVRFVRPGPTDNRSDTYPVSMLTSQLPADEAAGHEQQRSHVNGAVSAGAFGLATPTVSGLMNEIRMGREWHNNMIRLVAHWAWRGWGTAEMLATAEHLTLAGYQVADTRKEMLTAIKGAREKWNIPDSDDPLSGVAPKRPEILSLAELRALPPPTWLVHGLVPEKSLVVPYGPPKAGKTFVILSMGLHIAAGREWFGHAVQQGAVVYIAGEGTGGLSTRLRAMQQRYEIDDSVPFWVIPKAVNFRDTAQVNALETIIRQTVGVVPMRLLVIDTLARAMPGADENSAQEVGSVIAAADYLREALSCTTAPIHHEGKDGERGARGTSALRGAWDAAFQITGSKGKARLTVVDQKDAEAGQVLQFIMEEIAVGIGGRSSLVPVLDENPEESDIVSRRDIGGHAGMMLTVLTQIMGGPESALLPPFADLPSGDVRGVEVEIWRRSVYEKMPGVEQAARRQAFYRGMQTLLQREMINVKEPWVWLVHG